jgi:hypothetical protein
VWGIVRGSFADAPLAVELGLILQWLLERWRVQKMVLDIDSQEFR